MKTMHSAIYHGWLRHRRFAPRAHAFRYPLFMMYLDLSELDTVFRGRSLWSTRRAALAQFRRADHLGDPRVPLDHAVRDLVARETGRRPAGPIRLLTHLRYFGYCFNPVSFYYCFDPAGHGVETVVAEVNNTPWGERHCYVLPAPGDEAPLHWHFRKALHVSPFMPMDVGYEWTLPVPGERLTAHMRLTAPGGDRVFDATLALHRRPVTGGALAATLARFPFMTLRVIAAIHWQALRLWLKGVPIFTHPAKAK